MNLTQLPSQRTVYNSSSAQAAYESWTYDEAGTLTAASGLATGSHDDADYGTGTTWRGDLTTHTVWKNLPSGVNYSEHFTWDTAGGMLSHQDFRGYTTSYAYTDGAHAAPTRVTLPSTGGYTPQPLQTTYDQGSLQPTLTTDENGVSTAYNYDSLGRPTAVIRAQGTPNESWTQYGYCTFNGSSTSCPATGAPNDFQVKQDQNTKATGEIVTESVIDGLGRMVQAHQYESSGYITTTTTYDGLGRTATVTNPYRSGDTVVSTNYHYDALSRPTSVQAPDGTTVNTVYTGNQVQTTIPAGSNASPESIVKTSVTDAEGRMTSMTEGGLTTNYGYDALNNLNAVSNSGQWRTFQYDSRSELYGVTNPENGTIIYGYDGNGNMTSRTDGRSVTTSYTWDARNRLTQVSYSGTPSAPTVTYNYDTGVSFAGGRLVSVANSAATNRITGYDPLGRITGSSVTIGTASPYIFYYGYNLADSLTSETYPSGRVVTTGYDSANRPDSLTGNGTTNYVSGLNYAAHGGPSSFTYGNGLVRTQNYTTLLEPNEMADRLGVGTNPLLDLVYGWSDAGRNIGNPAAVQLQTRPTPSGSLFSVLQTFTYDSMNRISTAAENGSIWTQNFSYDTWGNMSGTQSGFSGTNVPPLPASGTYDTTTNRRNSASGEGSYDAAGNQLGIGTAPTVSYDAENRMIGATDTASNTYQYGFDGLGERVSVVQNSGATILWVHDAFGNLAAESTTGTLTGPCTTCYVSWDHLGSTRMVTDQNGVVVSRHDYLAYGVEIPGGVNGRTGMWGAADYLSMKYTSAEHDAETVLEYMNARHLSGAQGRFLQADPANAGADPMNPQSFNMYAYALNNPMAFADPSGLDSCEADTCMNVTDTASDWPTLPTNIPPGSCLYLILDSSPQTVCAKGVPTVTVYAKTPKTPVQSQIPQSTAGRLSCAANFGTNHSIAAAFGVQNTFLGGLFGGNTVSSLANVALAVSGNKSLGNQDAAKMLLKGGGQGIPGPRGVPGWSGASGQIRGLGIQSAVSVGYNAIAGVGAEPIELGITASGNIATSVAELSTATLSNVAYGVGIAKFVWDAGTFAYGYFRACKE